MTCVVAITDLFSGGLLGGDTRASCSDGSHVDGLQKVHVVGRQVVLGFSGSVRLGFAAVDLARQTWASLGNDVTVGHPSVIAQRLAGPLKTAWASAPATERELGQRVLVVGNIAAPPVEHNFPRKAPSAGYLMGPPHYEPEPLEACVPTIIGTARNRASFTEAFATIGQWAREFELRMPAQALMLAALNMALGDNEDEGLPDIGPYSITWLVRDDGCHYLGGDDGPPSQSWADFDALARQHGSDLAGAAA